MALDPSEIELKTPQFDARFPNTNQTKNCWQNYLDFHRCVKAKGDDASVCDYFLKRYKSLCPKSWVSLWLWLFMWYTPHAESVIIIAP